MGKKADDFGTLEKQLNESSAEILEKVKAVLAVRAMPPAKQ